MRSVNVSAVVLSCSVAGLLLVLAPISCGGDTDKPTNGTSSGAATTQDASVPEEAAAPGPKKKNAEVGCAKNEDCESNVCFIGGNQAFCTVRCTAADVATTCAPPFTGSCNKQGYCKRD